MKLILILMMSFSVFSQSQNTTIHCSISPKRTDEIFVNLVKAIDEAKAVDYEFRNGFAEITTQIEDGPYASIGPVDLVVLQAKCPNCYILIFESLQEYDGKSYPLGRYYISAEILFSKDTPVQATVNMLDGHYQSKKNEKAIKVQCYEKVVK